MRPFARWLFALGAILCLFSTGAKPYWQSRLQVSVSTASYQGPGDIVSGAKAWWGLRCNTAAYVGSVADVFAPADASHTLITCTAGGVLNETLQPLATTCASSCTVKTLFDQSAASNCAGACDLAQATSGNRPVFTLNCIGSLPCMTVTSGSSQRMVSPAFTSVPQAWTISSVIQRTANFTTQQNFVQGSTGSGAAIFFTTSTNTLALFAASTLPATASDSAFHAVQAIANGASSTLYVDGSATNGASGASALSGTITVGCGTGAANCMTGKFTELGVWPVGFSGGQDSSMNSNQHTYWGF